ncbi:hypothetical protein J6590_041385 [Homalodisca vitripennis]|nr:hypothetical protein J6590_041385 [Homalodisca vitripennis]
MNYKTFSEDFTLAFRLSDYPACGKRGACQSFAALWGASRSERTDRLARPCPGIANHPAATPRGGGRWYDAIDFTVTVQRTVGLWYTRFNKTHPEWTETERVGELAENALCHRYRHRGLLVHSPSISRAAGSVAAVVATAVIYPDPLTYVKRAESQCFVATDRVP